MPFSTFVGEASRDPTGASPGRFALREAACFTGIQKLLRVDAAENLDQLRPVDDVTHSRQ